MRKWEVLIESRFLKKKGNSESENMTLKLKLIKLELLTKKKLIKLERL